MDFIRDGQYYQGGYGNHSGSGWHNYRGHSDRSGSGWRNFSNRKFYRSFGEHNHHPTCSHRSPVQAIPEPSSALMFGLGAVLLSSAIKKSQRRN
jgi:hypothetical protein